MTSRSNLATVPLHLPTKPINHLSGTSTVVITKREDEIPSGGDEAELMDVTPIGVCLDCKLVYNSVSKLHLCLYKRWYKESGGPSERVLVREVMIMA